MLSLSSVAEETTNIQADPEVDVEVEMVRESIVLYILWFNIYSTYLWKAERTDDINNVGIEAVIPLSLSSVVEETTNIQAGPEVDVEVEMVRESIVFKYYDLTYIQLIYGRLSVQTMLLSKQ